jgi:hypothetical protein
MVTLLNTGAPSGVTVGGLKVQVVPCGIPEHFRLIGSLNPLYGINVTVTADACPGASVKSELLTTIAYAGAATAATLTAVTAEVEGA